MAIFECYYYNIIYHTYAFPTIMAAVGIFNQTQATEYCFTLKNVALVDSPFSEDNMKWVLNT